MSFPRFALWSLCLVPAYLVLAAVVPPFDDEFYYWCWSRDLQWSYYDHPAMVAYMIRAATEVFGHSVLAIRLPAVLSSWVVVLVIGWLSRPRNLLPLVLLSPMLTFTAVMVTPDTPLLMFWALYLAWLVKTHERLSASPEVATTGLALGWWALGGIVLGCGVLGKYTTGLAALAGTASFFAAGNPRRWFAGYVLHAAVAFLTASPILIYNIQRGFAPLLYQWGHSMSSPEPGVAKFAEFVGCQALLLGTVPFVVFVWAMRNHRDLLADPRLRPLACLFVLPFAFFLLKATRGHLEGNWAFPCYLACWPLAAVWYDRVKGSAWWRWATRAGFAMPVGATAFLAAHVVEPLPVVPPSADRPARQVAKVEIARGVADELRAAGYTGPVHAASYQWVALLRWHGVDARQIPGATRPSHFTEQPQQPSDRDADRSVVFLEAAAPRPGVAEVAGFGRTRAATSFVMQVRGWNCTVCWLVDCSERGVGLGRHHRGEVAGRRAPSTGGPGR
ncbi:Glycosyl transferase family 39 OS=Halothermothrix orenii (strain H 168 / OCM 544 / DSM 9562) GN=Hore_18820 PE=4 SV=1: PMT_2 [Gemmataceae bacterium]|nr:Glycosyl transferase family 39 OS=Halothermothrix orenii (strain H 168 / OCM 544 / DSM 9562) GN=Hore_18820 PE=4 SV=1: PMT_2 [Gemmataceae bacterium]VTT98524.1 Glycosyl transferase family 39 OS=Halothermothrix orenii (strain H 168 / OCM 544 / DSM 9562) GN=Hore_18820 PE=4 SV=1: PMT_2 [Gemmataceae bacterium]